MQSYFDKAMRQSRRGFKPVDYMAMTARSEAAKNGISVNSKEMEARPPAVSNEPTNSSRGDQSYKNTGAIVASTETETPEEKAKITKFPWLLLGGAAVLLAILFIPKRKK